MTVKEVSLLATHQTDTLDQIADYITLLHKGRIVFSMSKEVLMDKYILLSGEADKINALPKDLVVYRENGIYRSMAMIYKPDTKNCLRNSYDEIIENARLTKVRPTIEEIMYFMIKGESKVLKLIWKDSLHFDRSAFFTSYNILIIFYINLFINFGSRSAHHIILGMFYIIVIILFTFFPIKLAKGLYLCPLQRRIENI